LAILKKLILPKQGFLQLVDRQEGSTLQDIVDAVDSAIANRFHSLFFSFLFFFFWKITTIFLLLPNREEGVVLKNQDCLYSPAKRLKNCWIKMKPDYIDSLADDIDVIIIGFFFFFFF